MLNEKLSKSCVDATTLIPKRTFLPEPQEFSAPPNPGNFLAAPPYRETPFSDIESNSIDSHLTRIRKKLDKIETNLKIKSKNDYLSISID